MIIAVSVVLVAVGTATAVALLSNGNGGGGQTPNGSGATQTVVAPTSAPAETEPQTPADEQCTDEIKSNPMWVCLTEAVFDGDKITITYDSSFGDQRPALNAFHVHFWAAKNGENPPETTKGRQFNNAGGWYIDDESPSVRSVDSADFKKGIGSKGKPRDKKVCARIADHNHYLVEDNTGNNTFHTGNCVTITDKS
jgi:hypothetical protein